MRTPEIGDEVEVDSRKGRVRGRVDDHVGIYCYITMPDKTKAEGNAVE